MERADSQTPVPGAAPAPDAAGEPALAPPKPKAPWQRSGRRNGPALSAAQAEATRRNTSDVVDVTINPVGIFGWRKYCLYATVLVLLCLTIINIGLVAYVYRVMAINSDGAGPLHFRTDRLRVEGRAEFTRGLRVTNLTSFEGHTMVVRSAQDIVIESTRGQPATTASVTLDNAGVTFFGDRVQMGSASQSFLAATSAELQLNAPVTRVNSDALVVKGSVEATRISNERSGEPDVVVESVSQALQLSAGMDLSAESQFGSVRVNAFDSVRLEAGSGPISLSADEVRIEGLDTTTGAPAYALCACASGRLFQVPATDLCSTAATAACS